jgi:hypothetical protein
MILARVEQAQGVSVNVAPYQHMGDFIGRGLARSLPPRQGARDLQGSALR